MKQTIITLALSLALVATPVLAEETNTTVKARASTTPIKARVQPQTIGLDPREWDGTFEKLEMEKRKATTTERLQDMKANTMERRASTTERIKDIKVRIEERKASTTARRTEIQQNVAKRLADNASKTLSATIERLEKILSRVESRIAKVKAEGGVTTEAEGFVAEAKVHLSQAQQGIEVFASLNLTADKAQANFETIRAAAATVKEELKAAHENLMKAARALKGPKAGVNVEAGAQVETAQ